MLGALPLRKQLFVEFIKEKNIKKFRNFQFKGEEGLDALIY